MHERYTKKDIKIIWSDERKLALWQDTELAVIKARMKAGEVPEKAFQAIKHALESNQINVAWWKNRDAEIHHDLNAFIDERLRFIPKEYHQYFHKRCRGGHRRRWDHNFRSICFSRRNSESSELRQFFLSDRIKCK